MDVQNTDPFTQEAFEVYHLEQEQPSSSLSNLLGGPALPALGHATSGAIGAAISNVLTYPLALVITRLQVQERRGGASSIKDGAASYDGVRDAVQKIYRDEGGIGAFYTGIEQDTLKTCMDSFLFFLAYNFIRNSRTNARPDRKRLPVVEELLVGMAAGAVAKLCTTPISNVVTRKQTAARGGQHANMSTRDIMLQIRRDKGFRGLWSGYSASLVLTLNPSLTFLFQETFLRMLVKRENRASPGAQITFLVAAMSKALASSITYPFQLAKSRAQAAGTKPNVDEKGVTKTNERTTRRHTIFDAVLQIARQEGVSGLYQGLSGEVLKGFFSHGLTMLMKERVHVLVVQLYYAVLKMLRRYPSPDELAALAKRRKVASDAAKVEAANISAKSAGNEQLHAIVQQGVDTMAELYREGREATLDIVDEYVDTGDDGPEGWGW